MSLPGLAQQGISVTSSDNDMNLRGSLKINRTFPMSLDVGLAVVPLPIWWPKRTCSHSLCHVKLSSLIEISVDCNEIVRTELTIWLNWPRLSSFSKNVCVFRVQIEGRVSQRESTPHTPSAIVLVQLLPVTEYFGEIERGAYRPPFVAESNILHVRWLHETIGIEVNFTDCEHICSHCEAIVWHLLSHPNRTATIFVTSCYVERPSFFTVNDHKRFRTAFSAVTRPLETLLNC